MDYSILALFRASLPWIGGIMSTRKQAKEREDGGHKVPVGDVAI